MPDRKLEAMLAIANTLTADDLDCLRSAAPVATVEPPDAELPQSREGNLEEDCADLPDDDDSPVLPVTETNPGPLASRGQYERQRTRQSKVSTTCLGKEREKHDWWPTGTRLTGQIGSEVFTSVVVENPQVKSGRSMQITSGPASGRLCITPTRAAIEATEQYRQANQLGRGGGVTNGWEFWKPANA